MRLSTLCCSFLLGAQVSLRLVMAQGGAAITHPGHGQSDALIRSRS
jgi:hypothetical protein